MNVLEQWQEDSGAEGDDDDIITEEEAMMAPKAKQRVEVQQVHQMAARDTRYLWCSQILVLFLMLGAAAIVSAGTYIFLQQEEDDDFDNSYDHFTNTIKDAAEFHVRNIWLTTRSMASTVSSQAQELGMEFPLVTIPGFEALGGAARSLSGLELIFVSFLVEDNMLQTWNSYSQANAGWIESGRKAVLSSPTTNLEPTDYTDDPIHPGIFLPEFGILPEVQAPFFGPGPYFPIWMQSPPPFNAALILNVDAKMTSPSVNAALTARETVLASVEDLSFAGGSAIKFEDHENFHNRLVDHLQTNATSAFDHPHTLIFTPIHENPQDLSSKVVGLLSGILPWDRYLVNLLPEGVRGITCVVKNTCNQSFTYEIDGNSALYIGEGDFHDPKYDSSEVVIPFHDMLRPNETSAIEGHCVYSFHVYSTQEFEDRYRSNLGLILTIVVGSTFFVLIVTFVLYVLLVRRRNNKVVNVAARSNRIVSNLFPANVRDRLLQEDEEDEHTGNETMGDMSERDFGNRSKLKTFLQSENLDDETTSHDFTGRSNDGEAVHLYKTKPIADIFPDSTILFADIVGFTAWSSTREPSQVFTLLETIYHAFDSIAARRRVFKVETVGDCYVAVCGLPDPRSDHAVVMARFARACMKRMQELVHKLEVMLGPDTADLSMRMGLHSGPVTAGVLRGERARFQLFGDTMNTASRMESTGKPGMIQVSQETRDLLDLAGKGGWVKPREEKVIAKGKGELDTFWLSTHVYTESLHSSNGDSDFNASCSDLIASTDLTPAVTMRFTKSERLVKWNGDLLLRLLREIQATREVMQPQRSSRSQPRQAIWDATGREGTVLDEVKEIIHLPTFNSKTPRSADGITLDKEVERQLLSYIKAVAMMYQDNHFHSFEHCSHVTMSVSKLLSRIVAPDLSGTEIKDGGDGGDGDVQHLLHDHTYGITSDPLTQFACVFSALIHDVDHSGVPNTQLAEENPKLAAMYGGRSIAEQNSVDLAWNLLMGPEYVDLRDAIYKTPEDEARFRQLVVNSVMATDIMDGDLKQLRNERWDRAFTNDVSARPEGSPKDEIDRKATIVIEHLIQASDVAHTMQHWHVYRKWNEKLFLELYNAFVHGRAQKNPAEFWYQGELGFFDFYIIPLAKKLKDCGVFGVSSDEYLNYATKNRQEWEHRGRELVAEMLEQAKSKYPTKDTETKETEVTDDGTDDVESEEFHQEE